MTDMSKIYTDLQRVMAGSGAKVELISTNPDEKIDIGNILRKPNETNANQNTTENNSKREIVSKEKAVYKDQEGLLIRYADGSVEFQTSEQKGSTKIHRVTQFKNEKDFQNEKPDKEVLGKIVQDAAGKVKFVKSQEISYKYHYNGKISHQEVKNADGVLLNQTDYNTKGKPEKKLVYDKDGNIQTTYKYKYSGNDTQLVEKYDRDNKLQFNTTVKWDGDKRISAKSTYPDGALAGETKYDENGKIQSQKDYYQNGQLKADTVYHPNGVIKTQTLYDEQGKVTKTITDEIDGNFGDSRQVAQGDCYLMSSINAIRQLENGQELLSNLVKVSTNENGEKVYTVTFPGAQLAAEGLAEDGRIKPGTCAITGTYTFTESELQEIMKNAGIEYSLGDGDVILLEAAFKKYRDEVNTTLKANGIDPKTVSPEEAGLYTGMNENNILAGGKAEDAIFILTGKQSQVFTDDKPKVGLSLEDLQAGTATPTELPQKPKTGGLISAKAASPIDGEVSHQRTEMDEMLDEIMADSADGRIDNPATVAFKTVDKNGNIGGHALTIKAVTADTVVMINPWHPDQELVMSREEFQKAAYHLTITSMDDSNNNTPEKPNSGRIPPNILNVLNQYLQQQNQSNSNNNVNYNNNAEHNQQNISNVQHNNTVHTPATHGKYKIPKNITYTNMIKQMLKDQGIEPTKENIAKAREQFEALNPNAVKTYNGKRAEWKGNRYVLYNDVVKVPKFEI